MGRGWVQDPCGRLALSRCSQPLGARPQHPKLSQRGKYSKREPRSHEGLWEL